MADSINLNDICTPAKCEELYPELFAQPGSPSMKYLIRTRHLNGLSDCGAVIEPVHRRPLVVIPKFLKWMLNRKRLV